MAKRKMTFDEYDILCDRLAQLPSKPDGYWPDIEEINKLNRKNERDLDFMIWLVELNPEPETEHDKASRNYINKILRGVIELV